MLGSLDRCEFGYDWGGAEGGQPVGEGQKRPFQLSFNGSLRVDFQGARVTSDGGLILARELDQRLGFAELIERHLADARGKNTQRPPADLVRQKLLWLEAGFYSLLRLLRSWVWELRVRRRRT